MNRLVLLAVACTVFLVGEAPLVRASVQERQSALIVRELVVEGNRRVQEAVILGRVQTKVGSPFVPSQVAEDIRAIFALGYFGDVQVKVEEFEGGIKLTFVVVEQPFIRDIAFDGNRRIHARTLQETIDLKLGSIYNPVAVQNAREKLEDHYEHEGYFEAQIVPEVEKLPGEDVKLVFQITEGRRFTIDRIVIEGAKALSERQVKGVMETRERRFLILRGILRRQRLEEDLARIVALYQDHGYIQARMEGHEISVDRARGQITITITVVEGPQFTVGSIHLTGTQALPAEEVRRQIKLVPGEAFSRSNLRASIQGIHGLYGAIGRACAAINVTLEITEGSRVFTERIASPAQC